MHEKIVFDVLCGDTFLVETGQEGVAELLVGGGAHAYLIGQVEHFGEVVCVAIHILAQCLMLECVVEEQEGAVFTIEVTAQLRLFAGVVSSGEKGECGVFQVWGHVIFRT